MKKLLFCSFVLGISLIFFGCDDTTQKDLDETTVPSQNSQQNAVVSQASASTDSKDLAREVKAECTFDESKIREELKKYVDASCGSEKIDIVLAFDNAIDVPLDSYEMTEIEGKYYLNGKEMSKEMWDEWNKARDDEQTHIAQAHYLKRLSIVEEIRASGLIDDEDAIKSFIPSYEGLELHQIDACLLKKLTCFTHLINIDIYRPVIPLD